MQLKATDAALIKSTGLLPVFGYALLIAFGLGLLGGGYIAWKWKAGSAAIKENKQLRVDAGEWERIAKEQRQVASDQAIQFKAAVQRLDSISQDREDDRETIRQFVATQRSELQRLFDENAELRAIDAGPEFLRHWNKANAGPGAATPATKPAAEPKATVPGPTSSTQRPPIRPGDEPRRSDRALPRLSKQQRQDDRGRRRMAGDRLAVVLHGGEADRHRRGRMPA